jgi:hypothetical protein
MFSSLNDEKMISPVATKQQVNLKKRGRKRMCIVKSERRRRKKSVMLKEQVSFGFSSSSSS